MNQILAIAKHTIRIGFRRKILLMFLVITIILIISAQFFPVINTESQKIAMLCSVLLNASAFCTAIISILYASALIPDEISEKRIYGLLTKPVHRFQLLFGYWFGVLALVFILLFLMGFVGILVIYTTTDSTARTVNRIVPFTQREIIEKRGQDSIREKLPSHKTVWLSIREKNSVQIRYTYEQLTPSLFPDPEQKGQINLTIIPAGDTPKELQICPIRVLIENPSVGGLPHQELIYAESDKKINFNFPVAYAKGLMILTLEPADKGFVLGLRKEGIVLISPTGSFVLNVFKALLITFFKIGVLTAIAVMGSTFLSAPIATVFSFFIFLSGHLTNFLADITQRLAMHPRDSWLRMVNALDRLRSSSPQELMRSMEKASAHGIPPPVC